MRKQKGSWSLGSSGADRTPQVITKVFPDTAATHPLAHPRPWALLCGSLLSGHPLGAPEGRSLQIEDVSQTELRSGSKEGYINRIVTVNVLPFLLVLALSLYKLHDVWHHALQNFRVLTYITRLIRESVRKLSI